MDCKFVRGRRIDSFQKLRLLLWLHDHPDTQLDARQIAERLYVGDYRLVEAIIADLQDEGLVACSQRRCELVQQDDVNQCLRCLTTMFENPLQRQALLSQIQRLTSGRSALSGNSHDPDA